MRAESAVAGVIAVAVLLYLVYTLLFPERL